MANMSYCRFENTVKDLEDCYEHMEEVDELSDTERRARLSLIRLCQNIFDEFGYEIDENWANEEELVNGSKIHNSDDNDS